MDDKAGAWEALLAGAPVKPVEAVVECVCSFYGEPPSSPVCTRLLRSVKRLGVSRVYMAGGVVLGGCRLLGKGWAGVVYAAEIPGLPWPVAVKMLHPRSRRPSVAREAAAWSLAHFAGAAPRLVAGDEAAFAYRLLAGPPVGGYTPRSLEDAASTLYMMLRLAWQLDLVGVRHGELARPGSHFMLDGGPPHVYVIDFDSAAASRSPRNLTQLIGGLHRIPWLRACSSLSAALRESLRAYKAGTLGGQRLVEEALLEALRCLEGLRLPE